MPPLGLQLGAEHALGYWGAGCQVPTCSAAEVAQARYASLTIRAAAGSQYFSLSGSGQPYCFTGPSKCLASTAAVAAVPAGVRALMGLSSCYPPSLHY